MRSCVTNTSEFSREGRAARPGPAFSHSLSLAGCICIRLARWDALLLSRAFSMRNARKRSLPYPMRQYNSRDLSETYARVRHHEPKWNSLDPLSPSHTHTYTLSFCLISYLALARSHLVAATLPPDVWLSFCTVRSGFVRSDEPERTGRVRANYREPKHGLPGQFISGRTSLRSLDQT